jgi:hypothetical protein
MTVNENNQAEAKKFRAAIARARKLADQYRDSYREPADLESHRKVWRARDRAWELSRFVDGDSECQLLSAYVSQRQTERETLRSEFLTNEQTRLRQVERENARARNVWR